jgi:hypothetical protein
MIVPLYYDFRDLGLTDTYWGLILPQIGSSVAFGTFWMRAFFRGCRGRWWRRRGSTAPRPGSRCGACCCRWPGRPC